MTKSKLLGGTKALALVVATSMVVATSSAAQAADDVDELTTLQQVAPEVLDNATDSSAETSVNATSSSVTVSLGDDLLEIALPGESVAVTELASPGAVAIDHGDGSSSVPVVKDDGGVQVATVIDNAQAPARYDYEIDLPEGATLAPISDGSVAIVGADDIVLGQFAAPWAKDANGAPVATRFEIEGNTLTQVVEHVGAAYPVVADPFWIPLFGLMARWTTHALNQAAKRNISHKAIQRAVQEGKSKAGNQKGTTLFSLNGVYVVVNNKTGAIITTYTASGGGM